MGVAAALGEEDGAALGAAPSSVHDVVDLALRPPRLVPHTGLSSFRPLRFSPAEGWVGGFGGQKGEDVGGNDARTATATSEVTLLTFRSLKNRIDSEILIVPKKKKFLKAFGPTF